MTTALCLQCGSSKFGALCPCPRCGAGSTGDVQLDIAFSDHHLSHKTIDGLGKVIEVIGGACDEPPVCFWTFIRYVSRNHPGILTAEPPAELAERVDSLLSRLTFPPVEVEPGLRVPSGDGRCDDDSITIELDRSLADAVRSAQRETPLLWTVDARLMDGSHRGPFFLICDDARAVLIGKRGTSASGLKPSDVVAVRRRFSLVAPFRKREWIQAIANLD